MTGAATAADLAVALVALAAGYLIGSVPLASPAARGAGPGWAALALTSDLAKGVIPVAIGVVTVSWWIGWIAGVGAVVGSAWPVRRSWAPGNVSATFVGAAYALAPPVALTGAVIGLLVLAIARLLNRTQRVATRAGLVAGLTAYAIVFVSTEPDVAGHAALLLLFLAWAAMLLLTRSR